MSATGVESIVSRQICKKPLDQLREPSGIDGTDDRELHAPASEHPGPHCGQIGTLDRTNRLERAAWRTTIGVARKGRRAKGLASDRVGIIDLAPQPRLDLGPDPVDCCCVQPRCVDCKTQKIECRLGIPSQSAQPAIKRIAIGAETEFDRFFVESLLKGRKSSSPAPSSSKPASIAAQPALSAVSWPAPPSKANSRATSGTA